MAVERVKKRTETHELGQLKLYRDELEAIAQTLAEFGDLSIRVNDELTGTEPKDFARMRDELPERLEKVRLEAIWDKSSIAVDLGTGSRITLVEPEVAARGVLAGVRDAVKQCRVREPRIWPIGVLLVSAPVIGHAVEDLEAPKSLALLAMFSLLGLGLVMAVRGLGHLTRQKALIFNVPRAERPTFKERLFADGGVSAFWAVVGLVCGGVISWVVNQLPGL